MEVLGWEDSQNDLEYVDRVSAQCLVMCFCANEHAAGFLDDGDGGVIVWFGGDDDMAQPDGFRLGKDGDQGGRGQAFAASPWHDAITDVA